MKAVVETCNSKYYHMEHHWDNDNKYCPGIHRSLADAVRVWNQLSEGLQREASK